MVRINVSMTSCTKSNFDPSASGGPSRCIGFKHTFPIWSKQMCSFRSFKQTYIYFSNPIAHPPKNCPSNLYFILKKKFKNN